MNHGSCVGGKGRAGLIMFYFRLSWSEEAPASEVLDRAIGNRVRELWQKGTLSVRELALDPSSVNWN